MGGFRLSRSGDKYGENVNGSSRRVALLCALGAIVILCIVGIWVLLHVGDWLVVQDPLAPAKAIVVLSGDMPIRAIEASRIYQQNVAAQVWISKGFSPAVELDRMHISYIGDDFYNQKVLITLGVPADATRILEDDAVNTEEEVDEIARDLRQEDAHSVIVVTSKAHTRRVRYIWKHRIGDDPRLIIRYANDDTFDPAHWWHNSHDGLEVARELLGLANAWAGFPLAPEQSR
jgi:uncharacterized SAM-binding protein YcdF (DUF218 family)